MAASVPSSSPPVVPGFGVGVVSAGASASVRSPAPSPSASSGGASSSGSSSASIAGVGETLELFVPGRVCLFGEHSDWAGGYRRFNSALLPGRTIVCGTNDGIFARVRRHAHSLVLSSVTDKGERLGPVEIPMTSKALLAVAREGGFWSYAAGVAYKVLTDYRVSGLVVDIYRMTLPLKKGLSSSAAVCVLVAQAFSAAFNLRMTTRGIMEHAYAGELLTPSRCGRMDQA